MNTIVTFRHMESTEALKSYATEKIAKLGKYLPEGAEAQVILSVEKFRHKVEMLISAKNLHIQATEETEEMYASIDKVLDKLERRCRKYKEKLKGHKRSEEKGAALQAHGEPAEALESIPEIIRTKRFDMKPMTTEEAVMQLELLDKEFFIFSNIGTGAISVIYRRKDGNVGLIEPTA